MKEGGQRPAVRGQRHAERGSDACQESKDSERRPRKARGRRREDHPGILDGRLAYETLEQPRHSQGGQVGRLVVGR